MKQANSGKAGSARLFNLDGTDLAQAERHGKREDESSARRKVSDDEPLVYGGLNVRELAEQHRAGAKQQGKVKAVHALIQFPQELVPNGERQQKMMLKHAVDFVNEFHGGNAVFAARLDRDEKGTHKVDVFFLPKWEFSYKDGRTQERCGLGQYTKKQAMERYGKADRRACGSAVQDAFYEYLRDEMQIEGVMRPERKKTTAKDRVEPEEYALEQEKAKAALKRIRDDEQNAEAREQVRLAARALDREKADLAQQQAALRKQEAVIVQRQKDIDKQANVLVSAKRAAGRQVEPELDEIARRAKERRLKARGLER